MYFFCVSLCFSLALFHFLLFLCLSLFFFSCFLPFCFSFLFLVLAFCFCFVYFLLLSCSFLFLLFCLLSCFVLNHNLSFVFALHLLSSFCSCFLFCLLCFFFLYFLILGNQSKNIIKKTDIEKTAKMKNAEKKDTWTRAVSTIVCTNSVFFLFCVSLNFAFFAENTIKIGVSAPPPPPKKKQKKQKNNKFYKLKTGPSIS